MLDCLKIAFGRLGWTESEFYGSSFRAFQIALQGRDAADQYRDNKLNYLVRNLAYVVALSAFGGSKIKSPAQIWPHPWDDGSEGPPKGVTEEEIERLKKVFEGYDNMDLNNGTS